MSLFQIFSKKKKNPFDNKETREIVGDSFLDLSDNGFNVKVILNRHNEIDGYGETYDYHYTIEVEIKKHDNSAFNLHDIKDDIEIALSYLSEYNLKLDNIYYRQNKWTDNTSLMGKFVGMKSGTKKEVNLNKISKLKNDETLKVKITLK